jgi:hypothetical protein
MLYIYCLQTVALSWVGCLFYWLFLRQRGTVLQRKWSIIAIVLLSLALPIFSPQLPHFSESLPAENRFDYHNYQGWNVVDIADPVLRGCYQEADNSGEVCQCEIQQKAKLIVYTPNIYYDAALKIEAALDWSFYLAFGFFGFLSLAQIAALIRFARQQRIQKIEFNGQEIHLLFPKKTMPAAAFSLIKNYIIWSAALEQLPKSAREAILQHEATHLQQKDSYFLLFWQLLRAIWLLNPAFYILRKEWQQLSELLADQKAAQIYENPKDYARLLLALKTNIAPLAFTANAARQNNKSLFHQRVKAICQPPKVNRNRLFLLWAALAACLWLPSQSLRPLLQAQYLALQQYQILQQHNHDTGLFLFCPSCGKANH